MVADGEPDSQENVQVEEEEQPSNTYVIRPNYQHKYVLYSQVHSKLY